MPPELIILALNAAYLGLAYFWIYPAILAARPARPLRLFIEVDIAVSTAALVTASLLYAGKGLAFSLLLFDVPWWGFALLTLLAMEVVLSDWFRRRHGIDYDDF
ncbi:MAG: hypothetical protein AAGE03_05220 [Pseudomonadota bacterium]